MFRLAIIFASVLALSACGSSPDAIDTRGPQMTPIPKGTLSLPDRAAYYQKDKRWENERLGNTSDTMGTDGCLVTATAMALANLGFQTTPSDLNKRLTAENSFTSRGWLIWDGIRKVTDGRARAIYHDRVDDTTIQSCLMNGDYPLVQFYLPNGRSHWAMIVSQTERGYRMRDPLRVSKKPLIFPHSTDKFRAVRCVGLN
ncbi:hypothetical protein ACJ3XI_10850 [Litorimonas sp. RW-G-Af-16]|uniref:hypothetical protein n=1 Tax=Litorimonas sp. RW-G-Af-16 TaxID=3241168 RepID=UPI00390C5993